MVSTNSRRRHGAVGIALVVVVAAGLLYAVMPARADSAQIHASRAEYVSSQAAQAYPNPEYPNHKPLRGNYPGSYPTTAAPAAQPAGSDFDWRAAAVGAAGMLGVIVLLAAARATARITRDRRRRIPFVVDVRDQTPTSG
jgi:hypothetical protein